MTRGAASCLPPQRELAPPREDHLPGRDRAQCAPVPQFADHADGAASASDWSVRTDPNARNVHKLCFTQARATSSLPIGVAAVLRPHCGFAVVQRPLTPVGAIPAGGIAWSEVDEHLMLRRLPGTFVAGEMLDWEAPTGGYLLQASFSSGVVAARGALERLERLGPMRRAERTRLRRRRVNIISEPLVAKSGHSHIHTLGENPEE